MIVDLPGRLAARQDASSTPRVWAGCLGHAHTSPSRCSHWSARDRRRNSICFTGPTMHCSSYAAAAAAAAALLAYASIVKWPKCTTCSRLMTFYLKFLVFVHLVAFHCSLILNKWSLVKQNNGLLSKISRKEHQAWCNYYVGYTWNNAYKILWLCW